MQMPPDVMLVLGTILVWLSLPSLVSAAFDGRAPKVAAVLGLGGLGLFVWAVSHWPEPFNLHDLPDAFMSVFARFI